MNDPLSDEVLEPVNLPLKPLGRTGLSVSPLGFGAFKIGRNEGIKYAQSYDLPSMNQVRSLVSDLLMMGVTYFDTAPAYGISEQRLGESLPPNHPNVVVSTKTGETFHHGHSRYDYSRKATEASIARSLQLLGRETLDLVFIHSNGHDLDILQNSPVVPVLQTLKEQGVIRAIGFSGKTVQGAQAALTWADAIMVEYHLDDRSHEDVIAQAKENDVAVIVKKGLASGRLPAEQAIAFVLKNPGVTSLIVGGLNIAHMRSNLQAAARALSPARG